MNGREIIGARTMCLALCMALSAWCAAAPSDAARNHSAEMNAGPSARADRHPRTVVRGVFWPNAWKDHAMAQAAKSYGVPFVATGDLGCDDTMRALGNFWHQGVQAHPGDLGMAKTAERILGALFPHEKAVSQNKKEQQ